MQAKQFKKILQQLLFVSTNNPLIDILECIHIGRTEIVATDIITFIKMPFEADIDVCIRAKHLKKIVDALELTDEVSFAYAGPEETPWSRVSILVNGSPDFSIVGYSSGDFPKTPVSNFTYEIASLDLEAQKKFNTVVPFSSHDELRPSMMAICLGNGKIAATDGHRLVWQELEHKPLPLHGKYTKTDKKNQLVYKAVPLENVLIPNRITALVHRMKMDFTLFLGYSELLLQDMEAFDQETPYLIYKNEEMTLLTKMVDERYPDYENVIPNVNTDNHWNLYLNTKEFIRNIKQGITCANKTTHQLRFETGKMFDANSDGKLVISSEDLDFESEYSKSIAVRVVAHHRQMTKKVRNNAGDGFKDIPAEMDEMFEAIGFNGGFLLEFMNKLEQTEEVKITVFSPSKGALINDYALLMPLMLNQYA